MCLAAPLDLLLLAWKTAGSLSQYNVSGLDMLSTTFQSGNKILKPYRLPSRLITCHKLSLHCRRCSNTLFGAFQWYSSSYESEDITWCGFLKVNTTRKISVWISYNLEDIRFSICEHEIFSALQIMQDFLYDFPVVLPWIRLISAKHSGYKSQVRASSNLCIH